VDNLDDESITNVILNMEGNFEIQRQNNTMPFEFKAVLELRDVSLFL